MGENSNMECGGISSNLPPQNSTNSSLPLKKYSNIARITVLKYAMKTISNDMVTLT